MFGFSYFKFFEFFYSYGYDLSYIFCRYLKIIYILLLLYSFLQMSIKSCLLMVLNILLDFLFIFINGNIQLLRICLFLLSFISFCFTYFTVCCLEHIYLDCYVFLVGWHFDHYIMSCSVPSNIFCSVVYFSDINIATAFFLLILIWFIVLLCIYINLKQVS